MLVGRYLRRPLSLFFVFILGFGLVLPKVISFVCKLDEAFELVLAGKGAPVNISVAEDLHNF
jgi:hypothetical protein